MNEIGTTQVSYIVSVKTNFNPKLSATSVVLRIPTPLNTTIVDCKVQNGKAKYVPAENVIVWKCVKLFCDYLFLLSILLESLEYKEAKNAHCLERHSSRQRHTDKHGRDRLSTWTSKC